MNLADGLVGFMGGVADARVSQLGADIEADRQLKMRMEMEQILEQREQAKEARALAREKMKLGMINKAAKDEAYGRVAGEESDALAELDKQAPGIAMKQGSDTANVMDSAREAIKTNLRKNASPTPEDYAMAHVKLGGSPDGLLRLKESQEKLAAVEAGLKDKIQFWRDKLAQDSSDRNAKAQMTLTEAVLRAVNGASGKDGKLPSDAETVEWMVRNKMIPDTPDARTKAFKEVRQSKSPVEAEDVETKYDSTGNVLEKTVKSKGGKPSASPPSSADFTVGKTYKDKAGNKATYGGKDASGKDIWTAVK